MISAVIHSQVHLHTRPEPCTRLKGTDIVPQLHSSLRALIEWYIIRAVSLTNIFFPAVQQLNIVRFDPATALSVVLSRLLKLGRTCLAASESLSEHCSSPPERCGVVPRAFCSHNLPIISLPVHTIGQML